MEYNMLKLASFLSLLLSVLSLPSSTIRRLHQDPQNVTVPAALLRFHSLSKLNAWGPVPFVIPVLDFTDASMRFIRVQGANTQLDKREMLDLLDDQIDVLLANLAPRGPSSIGATTRSGRYFFRCWAKTETGLPAWSRELALATMRTFEGKVRADGLREVTFGIRVGEVLKSVCVTILAHPETHMGYGLVATKTSTTRATPGHHT